MNEVFIHFFSLSLSILQYACGFTIYNLKCTKHCILLSNAIRYWWNFKHILLAFKLLNLKCKKCGNGIDGYKAKTNNTNENSSIFLKQFWMWCSRCSVQGIIICQINSQHDTNRIKSDEILCRSIGLSIKCQISLLKNKMKKRWVNGNAKIHIN